MSQNEIEVVELTIEEAKKMVLMGDRVRRLESNKDFKKIVLEEYFSEEAARLAHLYTDPVMTDEQKTMIHNDLVGLGAFKRFLRYKKMQGDQAKQELVEYQETLEELREEEDQDGFGGND